MYLKIPAVNKVIFIGAKSRLYLHDHQLIFKYFFMKYNSIKFKKITGKSPERATPSNPSFGANMRRLKKNMLFDIKYILNKAFSCPSIFNIIPCGPVNTLSICPAIIITRGHLPDSAKSFPYSVKMFSPKNNKKINNGKLRRQIQSVDK